MVFAVQSVYLHWSQGDQCCPGSCSCVCGPWCGGVMACPVRCSLRTLLWRSQQSGWGVSWGQHGGSRRRTKRNHSSTSGQVSAIPAWLYHSRTKCHRQDGRKKTPTAFTFALFQNATVPRWIKWHLKKSIIGFNVTECPVGELVGVQEALQLQPLTASAALWATPVRVELVHGEMCTRGTVDPSSIPPGNVFLHQWHI